MAMPFAALGLTGGVDQQYRAASLALWRDLDDEAAAAPRTSRRGTGADSDAVRSSLELQHCKREGRSSFIAAATGSPLLPPSPVSPGRASGQSAFASALAAVGTGDVSPPVSAGGLGALACPGGLLGPVSRAALRGGHAGASAAGPLPALALRPEHSGNVPAPPKSGRRAGPAINRGD